jgi:hypothetical protein
LERRRSSGVAGHLLTLALSSRWRRGDPLPRPPQLGMKLNGRNSFCFILSRLPTAAVSKDA